MLHGGVLFGAHESVAGGLERAPLRAGEDACDALQLFTKNSAQWREPMLAPEALAAFRAEAGRFQEASHARRARRPVRAGVFAHASYLINLCSDDTLILQRSREALYQELCRSEALGIDCVVFHPGAHLRLGEEAGLDRVGESLALVLERTRGMRVRPCIENMAGQGTTVGRDLGQIGAMIDRAGPERGRLGVCIDTQHAFAAGHDFGPEPDYHAFWQSFERQIGLERLVGFHMNDSRCVLGARVDRHERIGKGEMGLLPFWRLANDPRFRDLPGILELPPLEGPSRYDQDLRTLRSLVGAAQPAAHKPFVLTPPEPKAGRRRPQPPRGLPRF